MAKISLLNPAARTRGGKSLSFEVVAETDITPEVVCKEGWCPVLFSKPRRAQANFLEASVIGFDVDEGMTLEQACDQLKEYKYIIGTTSSHGKPKGDKPACDRFRIILFLEMPVLTPQDYKATLQHYAKVLAIPMDQQAKDAARWFIPCVGAIDNEGLRLPPISYEEPQLAAPTHKLPVGSSGAKGKLSKATRDFLAQEDALEDWHTRFIKAAMDLKEQGYSEQEAEMRLTSASPIFTLDATDLTQLADVYANRGGALPFRPTWPVMGKEGAPVPNAIENLRYLLTDVLGYRFQANTRREVIYYTQGGGERQLLTDTLLATINTAARQHRLSAGEVIRDLIVTMAQEEKFDPILEPLNALEWDGKDHILDLFHTLALPSGTTAEEKIWYSTFLKRWLIGVVTKVYSPGSENNVLVFQGEQAAGKSRWLKRLAELWPEGYGEGSISPDDKDHELRHLDNFLWHVAEFDSTTSRREVGALKDYFTKDTVNVRRPYARLPIIGRSICSFCASVNSHEFLHDATGNRRYLVIPIVGLDANHNVSIPQVFAQAKSAMQNKERQWFSREEILEVNKLNEHFLSKEEYLEVLEARVAPGEDAYTIVEIMKDLGFRDLMLTRPIRSNIRTTLERNGVQKRNHSGVTKFMIDKSKLKSNVLTLPNNPMKKEN